jgi:hypothetical protein
MGQDPYSTKDMLAPPLYLRAATQTAPTGVKGISSVLKLISGPRSNFETFNETGTKDFVAISSTANSHYALPWVGADVTA